MFVKKNIQMNKHVQFICMKMKKNIQVTKKSTLVHQNPIFILSHSGHHIKNNVDHKKNLRPLPTNLFPLFKLLPF